MFDNVLGAALGVGIYKLWDYFAATEKRANYKTWLAVAFLAAGLIGCHMITPVMLRPLQMLNQLDFAVDRVSLQNDRLML